MMEGFSRLLSMKIYANWCNEYVGSRERLLLCSLSGTCFGYVFFLLYLKIQPLSLMDFKYNFTSTSCLHHMFHDSINY